MTNRSAFITEQDRHARNKDRPITRFDRIMSTIILSLGIPVMLVGALGLVMHACGLKLVRAHTIESAPSEIHYIPHVDEDGDYRTRKTNYKV